MGADGLEELENNISVEGVAMKRQAGWADR